ncbi:MAG: uroporphyrinogen-III C-methyltransferase [Pseudomonadota bacterium]
MNFSPALKRVFSTGKVYLVGAGPGDPDLLTVKAYRCLAQAEVIVYDRLVNKTLLDLAPDACELIYVGKRKHLHSMPQADIEQLLIRKALAGRHVVRLKGGDPFIFGRGGEEVAALRQASVAVEVIPGVTAAAGAASACTLPLTHREVAQAVTFVTAHRTDGCLGVDWALVTRPAQTVVFYMGFSVLVDLVAGLLAHGVSPAKQFSVISRATQADQQVLHTTLGTVLDAPEIGHMKMPALLVMHNTPAGICAGTQELEDLLIASALACG